jgi:predicted molibdopterin-dependent oxidoreductase YjgC
MKEVAALTPIYAGVTHARLEKVERLQWLVESVVHPGTPILYVEKFARGRGKFIPVE